MKKTDMELQVIRDKLRRLESEPPAGDVLPMPWSSPQHSPFGSSPFASAAAQPRQHASQRASQSASYKPNARTTQQTPSDSPQAAAIEALQQRSGAQNTQSSPQASRADELISQEIYRLEVHARNINERSQQQAADILALKRSAQQAALALRRQGIHSHSHPQLDTIAKFLEAYPSAAVPHLERNSQGYFALSHTTINLHHAEQEAQSTAETLRNRKSASASTSTYGSSAQSSVSQSSVYRNPSTASSPDSAPKASALTSELTSSVQPFESLPFSQPVTAGPSIDNYLESDATASRRHSRKRKQWSITLSKLLHRVKRTAPAYSLPTNNGFSTSGFSWMDGAIWFSGAAIARIIIEAIVLSYPLLRMPLLLILFSVISFAIYRVVVAKSSDLASAYRLGITLLGLFLGGSF